MMHSPTVNLEGKKQVRLTRAWGDPPALGGRKGGARISHALFRLLQAQHGHFYPPHASWGYLGDEQLENHNKNALRTHKS